MLISLHKQATTTPNIRAAIQASTDPAWRVAERYGISEQTVWKWRSRDSVDDRSHTPHRLQTTLTPAQEAVAVSLRKTLLLPLDDLLSVVREFLNPNVSRSGLDRCLRRHGVSRLQDLKPKAPRPAHKPFKAYEPGYIHIDVKYLPQMFALAATTVRPKARAGGCAIVGTKRRSRTSARTAPTRGFWKRMRYGKNLTKRRRRGVLTAPMKGRARTVSAGVKAGSSARRKKATGAVAGAATV